MFGPVNNPTFSADRQTNMMTVNYRHLVGKIGIDSPAGWVATVDRKGGWAFVHGFEYEPLKDYPDSASVEFWSNGIGQFFAYNKLIKMPKEPKDNPYMMETEVLSPYARLEPGDNFTFIYHWYAARIPPGMPVVGSNDLAVVCRPLKARLSNGKASLDGAFGVFREGTVQAVVLDKAGNEIGCAPPLPVSPLEPVILKDVLLKTPEGAESAALFLLDPKGQILGSIGGSHLNY
jgi:hypothetical protein